MPSQRQRSSHRVSTRRNAGSSLTRGGYATSSVDASRLVPRRLADLGPLLAVTTTLVLWASAFVAIRHLGHDFSAGPLTLARQGTGAVALGLVALRSGLPRPTGRQWAALVVIGVLWFSVYHLALNQGELWVDAGTAAMLLQVSPVLVAVLAAIFLHERFTATLVLGLLLAFAGVALIGLSGAGDGGDDSSKVLLGALLCLVSAVTYSVSLILQKPLVADLSAVHVTWLACVIGAATCLPFAPALVSEAADAPAPSLWWVVYLGVFPTAIAFTTYAYALRHMTASSLGVTTYLVPPLTIVMALVFLGETPPPVAYVGGALALIGVAIARRGRTATPAAASATAQEGDDLAPPAAVGPGTPP